MEKGKLQSGEGSSGYWDEFFFFIIIFLFIFFLLYKSLSWNKMFQSRGFITCSPQWRSHDGFAGCASLPKNGGGNPEPVGHISLAQRGKHSLIVLTCIGFLRF
jgi:hypothetical protein